MKTNIDEVVKRHLPSVPIDQMESDAARVLHRLRSMADEAGDRAEDERITDLEPVPVSGWRRIAIASAAAAVLVAALATTIQWRPSGGFAVVESVDGSLYQVVEGKTRAIPAGKALESGQMVRTNGGAGAMFALADGSRVEMRSQSELSLEHGDDGVRIRLRTGSIIVNAAKQPSGHLYVQTKDMTVSVVGTIFLVNAEANGSRVAVIEGEVRVREGATDTELHPGEQVSTSPKLEARPVTEQIAWSRQADAHRAILAAFAKGMADTAGSLRPLANTSGSAQATPGQTAPAQTRAARPEFEEASVRLCDPDNLPQAPQGGRGGGANSFNMTPGRTHALCMTVATLIRTAYGYGPMDLEFMNTSESASRTARGMRLDAVYGLGVEDGKRVRGGPDWVRSDRYTIEAIADQTADAQTMKGPMLQELLERRFHVKAHIEAEQVPAFALTVAPGGLKIKPMAEGDCSREPLSDAVKAERARKGWTGPVLITEAERLGIKPTCGTIYGERNGPNFRVEHVVQSPGSVARDVGSALGVRVIDRTGITDRFIFGWEYGPDESTPGILPLMAQEKTWAPRPGFDGPSTLPKAPSIYTVLEQQLGLKVEPIRVPREFIVIDRVERPSPN